MDNCPVCSVGKLDLSGSHRYCDKCGYVEFVVTAEYIEACAIIVSTLIANTRFTTEQGLLRTVATVIPQHLPQLESFMNKMLNGREVFLQKLVDTAKSHAINIQIGAERLNPVDAAKELQCSCGSKKFDMVSPSHAICVKCGANAIYEHDQGIYQPYFICSCGEWVFVDDDDQTNNTEAEGLVTCYSCQKGYMKNGDRFTSL